MEILSPLPFFLLIYPISTNSTRGVPFYSLFTRVALFLFKLDTFRVSRGHRLLLGPPPPFFLGAEPFCAHHSSIPPLCPPAGFFLSPRAVDVINHSPPAAPIPFFIFDTRPFRLSIRSFRAPSCCGHSTPSFFSGSQMHFFPCFLCPRFPLYIQHPFLFLFPPT